MTPANKTFKASEILEDDEAFEQVSKLLSVGFLVKKHTQNSDFTDLD